MQLCAWITIGFIFLTLSGCMGGTKTVAPVINGWEKSHATEELYAVQKGDTLYSIAFRFGLDYRDLASYNNISENHAIFTGERLRITAPTNGEIVTVPAAAFIAPVSEASRRTSVPTVVKKAVKQQPSTRELVIKKPIPQPARKLDKRNKVAAKQKIFIPKAPKNVPKIGLWQWPTSGKLIKGFSVANKGINIAGHKGQSVVTTAPGVVVYSGNGLPGYGKLIIVKHNADYLSAYAYNSELLVNEGQRVKRGQQIAKMGNTGSATKSTMLHFEIRKVGKPVDPIKYLARR